MADNLYAQAQALVNAQLGQLIGQTQQAYHRQGRQGRKYIRGLSKAFARELGAIGMGVEGAYDAGEAEMAAMNQAMAGYLSGQGNAIGERLGAQMQAIDAPPISGPTAAALGQSLAQQGASMGSYAMARLSREGTSDQAYAKALPGVAALSAIQHGRQFSERMASDLEGAIAQINQQGPALVNSLYGTMADQQIAQQQMALERQRIAQDQQRINLDRRRLRAEGGGDRSRMDGVYQYAVDLATNASRDPLTGLPTDAGYGDVMRQVAAVYRANFPGRSSNWYAARAAEVLATVGLSPGGGGGASAAPRRPGLADKAARTNADGGGAWTELAGKFPTGVPPFGWTPGYAFSRFFRDKLGLGGDSNALPAFSRGAVGRY